MSKSSTRIVTSQSSSRKRIQGQGLTEYIIIVALIALASIVSASFFGSAVKTSFLSLGSELVGGDKVDRTATVQTNFEAAKKQAESKVTLKNYNQ